MEEDATDDTEIEAHLVEGVGGGLGHHLPPQQRVDGGVAGHHAEHGGHVGVNHAGALDAAPQSHLLPAQLQRQRRGLEGQVGRRDAHRRVACRPLAACQRVHHVRQRRQQLRLCGVSNAICVGQLRTGSLMHRHCCNCWGN